MEFGTIVRIRLINIKCLIIILNKKEIGNLIIYTQKSIQNG